ncbi:hypothetical protein [Streptomyces cylindrosporus]|uniref:Uncharacterized protein n=1 Tax=Streptomyces cylindrosporus TaxID=2927583 RepID=A0ABS9YK25_9ACTN|nr:hypothetical protein [Streptomyces cylindrosporus]MCI3277607.1 hypothetical protein [Streptomyces cylindrosporus]
MRQRMELGDLLHQQHVDPSGLDPAPGRPTEREYFRRIHRMLPCTACGETAASTRVHNSPNHGPRWVDLCMPHMILTMKPAPRMPTTLEGILDDVREVAAEVGLTLRPISQEEWEETGRRAALRHGWRYRITISAPGQPTLDGVASDEETARERFAARVSKYEGTPGVRIVLVDLAERKTLDVWPDQP